MNLQEQQESILKWKESAIADGWSVKPTFKNEPQETAASLEKDGFKAMVILRERKNKNVSVDSYDTSLHIWGPDGLHIPPQREYSFPALQKALRHCNYCNNQDTPTFRVGFAGRCCKDCLPKQRSLIETPGWCD